MSGEVLVVNAARNTKCFKVLTNIFFPFAPRIESEEEATSGDSFVSHITRRFGNETIGPWESVVNELVVEVDEVVGMNDGYFVACIM